MNSFLFSITFLPFVFSLSLSFCGHQVDLLESHAMDQNQEIAELREVNARLANMIAEQAARIADLENAFDAARTELQLRDQLIDERTEIVFLQNEHVYPARRDDESENE
jgi:predicted  nucleic acid-binding Zn-ribbon protein